MRSLLTVKLISAVAATLLVELADRVIDKYEMEGRRAEVTRTLIRGAASTITALAIRKASEESTNSAVVESDKA